MSAKFKLIEKHNATCLGSYINSHSQLLKFYEHPLNGEESPVIVCFPSEKVACSSTFYELDDMTELGGDYEPYFYKNDLGDWCLAYNYQI